MWTCAWVRARVNEEEFMLVLELGLGQFCFSLSVLCLPDAKLKRPNCVEESTGEFGVKRHTYIFRTTHIRAIFLVFPILGDEQIHIPSGRFGKSLSSWREPRWQRYGQWQQGPICLEKSAIPK